jgi:hypothetical protein
MVDGGMSYIRRTVEGLDESIVISQKDYDGLLQAMDDPSKSTLGKLCNIARYLRDSMGINISERNKR